MSAQQSKGTALITGASTGIGAVYADRLARRGYDVILVARDQQKLSEVAERIEAATGRKVETLAADLNEKSGIQRVSERLSTDPNITALVNNAGVGSAGKLLDSKIDDLESMIQLNVTTLTQLTLAAVPSFVARANGLIINISSIAALAPEVLNGTYSGTKAYVVNFTQALHKEVETKGVTLQVVLPGATSTPFWGKAGVPLQHLPNEIVMTAEDMVDTALAGLDQGELVTIPSLPDVADWEKFEAARRSLGPNLSRKTPATRYGVSV
jgi:uncharacterized protein